MNRRSITALVGTALALGCCLPSRAEVKENPYQIIIERNPFGLRPVPPPPPPPTTEPPPPPPQTVFMTGLTTLLGPAKVFLELKDPQTQKIDRPPALLEGESFKSVTVVSIDTENNRVKIKNGEAESWLDFEKNGVKATASAAPAPVPHPGFPGAAPAAGVPVPGAPAAPAASSAVRGGLIGGGSSPLAAPAGYNPGAVSSAAGLPPRTVRTDGAGLIGGSGVNPNPAPATPAASPSMTPEQAQAIIEARRMQLQQQGDSRAAILPTTRLGQELNNLQKNVPVPR